MQRGLERSGRSFDNFRVVYSTTGVVSIAEDPDQARLQAQPMIAWRLYQEARRTYMKKLFSREFMDRLICCELPGQQDFLDNGSINPRFECKQKVDTPNTPQTQ